MIYGLTEDQERQFKRMKVDASEHRDLFSLVEDFDLWPEREGMTYREKRAARRREQIRVWKEWGEQTNA